jgi:hypothetical protein
MALWCTSRTAEAQIRDYISYASIKDLKILTSCILDAYKKKISDRFHVGDSVQFIAKGKNGKGTSVADDVHRRGTVLKVMRVNLLVRLDGSKDCQVTVAALRCRKTSSFAFSGLAVASVKTKKTPKPRVLRKK